MTYKEFIDWCNCRACTGLWTIDVYTVFMGVAKDVNKHFLKERYWQKNYKELVEPIIHQVERMY